MNKKEYRIANVLIIAIMIFFAILAISLSSNLSLKDLIAQTFNGLLGKSSPDDTAIASRCSNKPALNISSPDLYLRKLQQYQNTCQSFVTDRLMIFTLFPQDSASAATLADNVAGTLLAFQQSGVNPLIIAEPYIHDGPMSYRRYMNGEYDQYVREFFENLQQKGITSDSIGTWVPFPESNTPSWDNKDTEPKDFSTVVNKYLRTLRAIFPTAKGSILLNATTYEPTDLEYADGNYLSLVSYVQDIDKRLVSSVGIQGFPWVSRANQNRREIFRASEFLQPDYAIEAARELRTRDIWFNTGSFAAKYTNAPEQLASINANDRKAILEGILQEAQKIRQLQQNEYRVSINLFAEDKSGSTEATDWSYLNDPSTQKILKEFLSAANQADIPVWIYDKDKSAAR